jgi:arginyl-tRNA synthetase
MRFMSDQDVVTGIQEAVQKVFGIEASVHLDRPEAQFGDFTTNVAMQLAKQLQQPPRVIAEAIAEQLQTSVLFAEVAAAGPGFINMKLTDKVLAEQVWRVPNYKLQQFASKQVVAEYSDPNPFKALHAGHLYTTIVGDVIARLFEEAGAEVHRINYGGDVGLHVGRAMWAIIAFLGGEHPEKLATVPEAERSTWLSARYVEGSSAYDNDDQAKQAIIAANKRVYQLHTTQDHESPFAQIYWTCREWSYDGFRALYNQLQITPFERFLPESESTPAGLEIVAKGTQQGVFKPSQGATVFEGEPYGLHTRVFVTAEGLPTYETKDLGLATIKWRDYTFDVNVIITANDIVEYMKVVLKALSSFYPEVAERTVHLTHGVVKLPGGVKMSSRKGNTLLAQDILDSAREASLALSGSDDTAVVVAAVKYVFLKQRIGGDIIYNPKESVSLEGNSGPYLQYAHARARSILRKVVHTKQTVSVPDFQPAERLLARKLSLFPEVLTRVVDELAPHHLCTYAYELTQEFNRFYEHNRVIDDERQEVRAQLVETYADVLARCLQILGMTAPQQLAKKGA